MKFCNSKFFNVEFINKCFIDRLECLVKNNDVRKVSKARLRDTEQKLAELCSLYECMFESDNDKLYHNNITYTYMYDVLCDYAESYDIRNGAFKKCKD